ncbi:MAG: helix-turn-helix domain-containing protein [Ancalomicrobiaceae bacterium]|nr:helix-turn-helix domain-containing protein [Ancalomicrobiaceae bacterium]
MQDRDRDQFSQRRGDLPSLFVPFGSTRGRAAFQDWSDMVADVFDTSVPATDVDDFQFGFEAWNLGALLIAKTQSAGQYFQRGVSTINRSTTDHYLIQIYETGSCSGTAGGKEIDFAAGDIWIMDMTGEISTRTSDFKNTNIVIPRDMLDPLVADPLGLHGARLDRRSPHGRILGDHLLALAREAPQIRQSEAAELSQATVQLVAACVGPSLDGAAPARQGLSVSLLRNIRKFIQVHLSDQGLGPDIICQNFNISRSALYRLFEPFGGIAHYVRDRRLRRCLRQIASSHFRSQLVSEIAYRCGFTNDASFSRAFRRQFGISPSEVRAMADAHRLAIVNASDDGSPSAPILSNWLQMLAKDDID